MTRNDRARRPYLDGARDLPYPLDGVPPALRPGRRQSVSLLHTVGDVAPELDGAITESTAAAVDYLQDTGGHGLRPHSHLMVDNHRPVR